jgi:transcriptional regulator with XRE-family HTH domain
MIQRYEYGLCRISASTLYAMAFALDVPVSYFFDGLPLPLAKRMEAAPSERSTLELAKTRYGRMLAELFPLIPHRGSQRAIVELVKAMVEEGIR